MTNMEVRIQYSRLLDPFFKSLFEYEKRAGVIKSNSDYPTAEVILEKVKEYNNAWQSRALVLNYVQEILRLDFYEPIIDAYVIGHMRGSISTPILMGSQKSSSEYIDTLTHEILHRLISDNKQKIKVREILPTMFPNESVLCRVHVVVHAILKKIYLEFLKEPDRFAANKKRNTKATDYARAWEIVDVMGETKIIEQFKSFYTAQS